MAMEEVDNFKEAFKLFKKLSVQDLLAKVIDLRDPTRHASEVDVLEMSSEVLNESVTSEAADLGLRSPQQWRVYGLKTVPGLLVIPNPFLVCGQHHWVRRCLVDYPIKPNVCNLDAHMTRPGCGQLWPHPQSQSSDIPNLPATHTKNCPRSNNFPKRNSESGSAAGSTDRGSSCHRDLGRSCRHDQDSSPQEDSQSTDSNLKNPASKKMKLSKPAAHSLPLWLSRDTMLYKLRWVTLGYHYDWSTKEYSPDNVSAFPEELGHLSSFVLKTVGLPGFRAEAGIVNYYHLDSTLSGHTDHSEKDLSLPLLSISLGQSAVFLIGGPTKQTSPLPLLLNSGDIVVMSGESRLAYHGVPRVLPPSPDHPVPDCLTAEALVSCTCWRAAKVESHWTETTGGRSPDGQIKVSSSNKICAEVERVCDTDCATGVALTQGRSFGCGLRDSSDLCCCVCGRLADSWDAFVDYLSVSRVNINLRQVVSDNCKFGT